MLWPLLVEYTEPGVPATSHLRQQGNMALFLTLFIVTCVEVLIVKVAQSERELEMMLTPHDPPYLSEFAEDDNDDDDDDDICKVRSTLELTREKRLLVSSLLTEDFLGTRKKENGVGKTLQEKTGERFQSDGEKPARWNEHSTVQRQEPSSDTVEVRERMEKMVEAMIGGPLDGTTVGQVSTHSAYKKEDSSDVTGSNLKRLIKQIVDEAMCLPDINEVPRPTKAPKDDEDLDNKSYEDILATAILNKVIENFQNKRKQTEPSPKPRLRHRKFTKTNGSDELKSDGDWSDTSRSDQLSLTIEEYIEEVTTAVEVSEDDASELSDFESNLSRRIPFPESGRTVVDAGTDDENSDVEEQSPATELVTSTSSWEENWLFQKKRLRTTPNAHHPVPVPMLVPNPSEDFRALVGGVDADDLSDMSECSDSILQDFITTEDKPPETTTPHTTAVEEQNETVKVVLAHITEESFFDKLGSPRPRDENEVKDHTADADVTEETPEQKLSESEQMQLAEDGGSATEDPVHEDATATDSLFPSTGSVPVSSSTDSEDSLIRCRVAEREKEKWMNPVPLPDNPYSPENIEKREQQRRRNEYFRIGTYSGESIDFPDDPTSSDEASKKEPERPRFARDYYVNASKQPSGRCSPPSDQRLNGQSDAYTETPIKAKMIQADDNNNDTTKRRIVDKSEFCLPSVRELAKQFTTEGSQIKPQSKQRPHSVPKDVPAKETELDYSTIPVSEIILTLQQAAESPPRENRKLLIYDPAQPTTKMEVLRQSVVNCPLEQTETRADEAARFNGKQVHSLTARSISKEFREGLKNNSYQKVLLPRVDRTSSGGESDQGDVVCSKPKISPTPSVDLKNMKKFWEEIITANSSSARLK